jgi:hypothetical protein
MFSKKLVEAPFLIARMQSCKIAIEAEKAKAQKLDDAHKNLVDSKTNLINYYQAEIANLTGYPREILVEQDFQDAASFVLGNSLYPNNPNNPPPSTAPNIWTKTKPYAKNKAVGKFFNEQYGTQIDGDDPLLASILADIASYQSAFTDIELTTGQSCNAGGTCSFPAYTTQPDCTSHGGTWTSGPDIIANNPTIQSNMSSLISKVNRLKVVLTVELGNIYTADPDPARAATAAAAVNDINNNIMPAINTWLGYTSFNTAHGQTTCVGFYSYDSNLLAPTKMHNTQLNALKLAFQARQAFVSTRESQINGYIGSITQNLNDGSAIGNGFYFERWGFIGLRLNMLGGSLIQAKGYDRSSASQDEQIANLQASIAIYSSILTCSILAAPSSGTKYIQLASVIGLSEGDNLYIVSDTQEELPIKIVSIQGNRITVGQNIPAKYRPEDFARIYKDIS